MSAETSVARRTFIKTSAGLGLAGATLTDMADASADQLDREAATYEALIGETFEVGGSLTSEQLVLEDVTRLSANERRDRPGHVRQEGFSVLFRSTTGADLPSGTYQVRQASLGGRNLFLHPVCVSADPATRHYEVIFN